jgi:Ca2+/Na+ antiporter
VTVFFVVSGIIIFLPYPLSFFLEGLRTSPSGLVGGLGIIGLAVWFSRGSNIARYLLLTGSVSGALVCGMLLVLLAKDLDAWLNAMLVAMIFVSGYCVWVLALSAQARAELSRRRDVIAKQESEKRRQFYEQLGENSPSSDANPVVATSQAITSSPKSN